MQEQLIKTDTVKYSICNPFHIEKKDNCLLTMFVNTINIYSSGRVDPRQCEQGKQEVLLHNIQLLAQ